MEQAGGGNYRPMINDALKAFIATHEETLESLAREELKRSWGEARG